MDVILIMIFALMCITFGYTLGCDRTERKHRIWLEKHYKDLEEFYTPKS